ncbi:hypothetical protein Bbelb_139460 [Branchiostoma belcheri]|nr:hypothetical protein Bbelb_139460 [Branchiostoma belcheri]
MEGSNNLNGSGCRPSRMNAPLPCAVSGPPAGGTCSSPPPSISGTTMYNCAAPYVPGTVCKYKCNKPTWSVFDSSQDLAGLDSPVAVGGRSALGCRREARNEGRPKTSLAPRAKPRSLADKLCDSTMAVWFATTSMLVV